MIRLLKWLMGHPLACGQRAQTLARFVDWQVRSRLARGRSLRRPWIAGTTMVARRGMTGASGNLYVGLHEFPDMAFFLHLLRPGDLFVDAGANVGSYTILAGAVAGASVAAFEPAAETLPALQANIDANAIRARVHAVALGDREGEVRFSTGRDSVNQIDPQGAATVPLATLDSFALEPTAIKADLEGGEEAMLRGAARTLASPKLLAIEVETVTEGSRTMLERAGFARRWYDPLARALSPTPCGKPHNQLWVRDEPAILKRVKAAPVHCWGRARF